MNNKKFLISAIIFVILTIGIVAGVILVRNNQDIREKAAPSSSLMFNPQNLSIVRGQNFVSNSKISTGTNRITGIDIEFTYNPAVIRLNQVTPTGALANFTSVIRNEIDNTTGKGRYIAYVLDRNLGITGDIDILTLTGTVLPNSTAGSYQITYGAMTTLAALNEGQNVVINKTPLTLTVTLATATPSPSPTATRTPSPTPSPTRSASPMSTRSPSPTPTPTRSPSPSPLLFPAWDIDQNGLINIVDIGLVVDDYGRTNPVRPRADVDRNGTVNIVDIGIIVDHYQ